MLTFAKKSSCKQAKLVTKKLKGGKAHDINCPFLFVNWVRFISGKIEFLKEVNKFYLQDEKNCQGKNYIYFRKKLDHVNSKQLGLIPMLVQRRLCWK
jgi:hypothetical protein